MPEQEAESEIELETQPRSEAPAYIFPLEDTSAEVTNPYGWRENPVTKQRSLHSGVDFAADYGTNVLAVADGTVLNCSYDAAYGYKVLGRIPESVCVNLLNQYEAERREKQERRKELTEQLAASRETESSVDAWLDMMQDYTQLEELDRPTLVRLIQKIEISERYPVDDHKERDIHI